MNVTPFLKWAGSKRRLVQLLQQHMPAHYGTYFEPCLGSGALFFATRPKKAVLSDANARLVRTYQAVRDEAEALVDVLDGYTNDPGFFKEMRQRSSSIDACSDVEVAAWLIYLNRTAFNGLYRVNSANEFNVPFGKYKAPTICDAPKLAECSNALQGVTLTCTSFEVTMERAQKGDFAYFDPPYLPVTATSSFADYTATGFGFDEHVRLRDLAVQLGKRGVNVLISNSDTATVAELYRGRGFHIDRIEAPRSIAARATSRGPVKELLISNYKPSSVRKAGAMNLSQTGTS